MAKINYPVEKLIKALSGLISLRTKLHLNGDAVESALLDCAIVDLAKGLGSTCGLSAYTAPDRNLLHEFVTVACGARERSDLAVTFSQFEQLHGFLDKPYFDESTGLAKIRKLRDPK